MPDSISTVADFPGLHAPAVGARLRRWRHIKDVATRHLMAIGGVCVIVAIALIAFYLVYVVLPLFYPARLELLEEFPRGGDPGAETLFLAVEEQREIGFRLNADGGGVFFNSRNGEPLLEQWIGSPYAALTAFAAGDPTQHLLALGHADGSAVMARYEYDVKFRAGQRSIIPKLTFPFGEEPLPLDPERQPIALIAGQYDDGQGTVAAVTQDRRLLLLGLEKAKSLIGDSGEVMRTEVSLPLDAEVTHLLVDVEQRELYFADVTGQIHYYDISRIHQPRLVQKVVAAPAGVHITGMVFISGGISIVVGDSRGHIAQWFPVRDPENNYALHRIRSFEPLPGAIAVLAPEHYRKGFIAADAGGQIGIYHATAHRTVKIQDIGQPVQRIAVAPRADGLLLENADGGTQNWSMHNEHPEVSWSSLWGKVWYESRQQPEYIWQSSSASSDFEPKFSVTPLVFGTVKATLYAILFAVPLAIMGAIYTAYFMSVRMRGLVKPIVEIMAALPSVILGFLAGLWFAPFLEQHLPSVLLALFLVPAGIIGSAWGWQVLPAHIRRRVPDGMEAAILIPVLVLALAVSVLLSQPVELLFFGGNTPLWLNQELGITYEQRNSLVVGIAIGFAVIPTIFSISEDAIFGVPKHLTTGSLALGATTWQTMVRVVLLTASPGIFSAVMIGLGRAVGETMIVVMATGNTAIMDLSIFQGFRALSANIAVEMPESEVGGTHYRILFLAALVLFLATFFFNTAAEIVRQRLRVKYASL